MINGAWSSWLPSYGKLSTIPHHWYTLWVASRVLDSLHLALVTTMMYHYTVTNWGDVAVSIRTTGYVMFEFFTQNLGPNRCLKESGGSNRYRGTLTLLRLIHKPMLTCVRRSWLWLCSASLPVGSGIVSIVSLSPLECIANSDDQFSQWQELDTDCPHRTLLFHFAWRRLWRFVTIQLDAIVAMSARWIWL